MDDKKEAFISEVNRGGLTYPSDLVYISCVHIWQIFSKVNDDKEARNFLLSRSEPKKVFEAALMSFMQLCDKTKSIIMSHCENEHSFEKIFRQLCQRMFNCFAKNMCNDQNSRIHMGF